jgi:hypothetical protein
MKSFNPDKDAGKTYQNVVWIFTDLSSYTLYRTVDGSMNGRKYTRIVRNVLVFECADISLKDYNRQTDGQTGTQTYIHVHEHKRNDVVCRIMNISYASYYKIWSNSQS